MIPGLATSVPAGNSDDMLQIFEVVALGDDEARVTVRAKANYGDTYWGIVVDGQTQHLIYLPEGESVIRTIWFDPFNSRDPAVSVVPNGDWSYVAGGIDLAIQQIAFLEDKAKNVRIEFNAVIDVIDDSFGDTSQLSGWSLSGLRRFTTGSKVDNYDTRVKIDLELTTAGSIRTLNLYAAENLLIATGSRTGDGVITLSEQNDSGLSGSVTVAYSSGIVLGTAYLHARWASSYTIKVGTTYPTALVTASVEDDGFANRFSEVVEGLDPGTYEYWIDTISDNGVTKSATAALGSFTIPGRPEAPGDISLQSTPGDWTGTNIEFAASATGGATYRIYDSDLDDAIDWGNIAATEAAGSGTIQITLPSLSSAAAGIRRVSVVAVNGGVEDSERKEIAIEYDSSGNVVPARPNVPEFFIESVNGLDLTVRWVYERFEEKGIATELQFFLVAEGATASYGVADATQALDTTENLEVGTTVVTASGAGWYKVVARAATSGGTLSENTTESDPEYATSTAPSEVSTSEIFLDG